MLLQIKRWMYLHVYIRNGSNIIIKYLRQTTYNEKGLFWLAFGARLASMIQWFHCFRFRWGNIPRQEMWSRQTIQPCCSETKNKKRRGWRSHNFQGHAPMTHLRFHSSQQYQPGDQGCNMWVSAGQSIPKLQLYADRCSRPMCAHVHTYLPVTKAWIMPTDCSTNPHTLHYLLCNDVNSWYVRFRKKWSFGLWSPWGVFI